MRPHRQRARLHGIALTALLAAPSAQAAGTGLAFISNEKGNTVVVLDPRTDTIVRSIDVCGRPRDMEWNADRTRIYVACGDDDEIGIVDVGSMKQVDAIRHVADPEAFEIDAAQRYLYVSNEEDAALSVIDLEQRAIVAMIESGEEPEGVLLTTNGKRIWLTAEASNLVHVIDVEHREPVADILVGTRPRRLVVPPDEREVWVSCELAGRVDIIDPESFAVKESVSFLPRGFRQEEVTPVDLVMARDGKTAYVALGRANHVAVVDVASREVRKYILVGQRPWGLTLSQDERRLYVSNGLSDDISIIDTGSLRTLRSVPVGLVPYKVLIDG
jgi:PQQ-dependent catabolism-associated beta-propeller protein